MRDEEKSKEQLLQELAELRACHAKLKASEQEREQLEQNLQEQAYHLQERVKELQCLYGMSELVAAPENSNEDIFQGIVELIPSAWQYPDITCARLIIDNQSYYTENFQETVWKQSAPILVQDEPKGVLEVYYLEARPISAEGPFLAEERALLTVLAERLGRVIEYQSIRAELQQYRRQLEQMVNARTAELISINAQLEREIAERKRAEVVLQKSEQKYRQLVETLQEGIWVIDAEACTTFVNPRMAEMLGYTVEDMLGKHLFEFMDEQGVRISQRNLDRRQQGITEQHDFEFLRKDGSRIYTNIETSPILDERGAYAGAIAGVADMTERRMAEEQIKASLREKEHLLQEIHHRVKNNLQVIASLLYLQAKHIQDAQLQQQFWESRNRVRSIVLVHETLYQSNNLTHIGFDVYIRHLVAQVFQSYGEQSQHVAVSLRVQKVSLSIEAATPCGLIINELVSNALKHAFPHKAGELWVTFEINQEQNYILTVSDNGIGLPEDFDVQKAESLGIQLVHSLVEQLDGNLDVATGNGTSFSITFSEPEYTRRI